MGQNRSGTKIQYLLPLTPEQGDRDSYKHWVLDVLQLSVRQLPRDNWPSRASVLPTFVTTRSHFPIQRQDCDAAIEKAKKCARGEGISRKQPSLKSRVIRWCAVSTSLQSMAAASKLTPWQGFVFSHANALSSDHRNAWKRCG